MNTDKHVALPPLPEPDAQVAIRKSGPYDARPHPCGPAGPQWVNVHISEAMRAYAAEAVRVALDDAAATLAQALCDDCENGMQWLNLAASKQFAKDYPHLRAAISNLAKDRT